jgi:hypothetical protein
MGENVPTPFASIIPNTPNSMLKIIDRTTMAQDHAGARRLSRLESSTRTMMAEQLPGNTKGSIDNT